MTDQELRCEVTFHFNDADVDELKAKAREVDLDVNGIEEADIPDYTLPQALQVVWHMEPQWLHQKILHGWTLDKGVVDGVMRPVWTERARVPDLRNQRAVEQWLDGTEAT